MEAGIADISTLGYLLDQENEADLVVVASKNKSGFLPTEPSIMVDSHGRVVIQSTEEVERFAF